MPDTTRLQDALADGPGANDPVRLSVMTASGVQFDWHEGTAVVQELYALIAGGETPVSTALSDQEHVLVQPDGRLSLSSGGQPTAKSARAQVATLARLLLSLVSESDMPVKLRLMLLSAISDASPFATAADFSRALAYFERPGRAADIRSAYLRWRLHSLESVSAGSPSLRLATTKHHEPPAAPRLRRHRRAIALAGLTVLLAGGTAAWWFLGRAAVPPLAGISQAVTDLTSRAWMATSALVEFGAAAVRSVAGGTPEQAPAGLQADAAQSGETRGRVESSAASRDPNPAGTSGPTPRPGANASAPPPLQTNLPPFKAFDLSASLPGQGPSRGAAVPFAATTLQPGSAAVAGTATRPGDIAAPIYSIADRDVEPPVPVRPKIATGLPADERAEDLTVVDLTISDDGQVESLKLVRPARGVRETMILSAIKAWRFRPALKDGQPVRYFKRIWISLSPIGSAQR